MSSTFSLEGAIVERAHANLRHRISQAMEPMRTLLGNVSMRRHQDFRLAFDKFEHQLFEELRPTAEKEAMETFVATYDELASIVNAAKAKQ